MPLLMQPPVRRWSQAHEKCRAGEETGILPGVPVDIEADEDGVHIRKHVPTCHFCGTVDDVKTVCGIEICRGCAEKIMEEFKG